MGIRGALAPRESVSISRISDSFESCFLAAAVAVAAAVRERVLCRLPLLPALDRRGIWSWMRRREKKLVVPPER